MGDSVRFELTEYTDRQGVRRRANQLLRPYLTILKFPSQESSGFAMYHVGNGDNVPMELIFLANQQFAVYRLSTDGKILPASKRFPPLLEVTTRMDGKPIAAKLSRHNSCFQAVFDVKAERPRGSKPDFNAFLERKRRRQSQITDRSSAGPRRSSGSFSELSKQLTDR